MAFVGSSNAGARRVQPHKRHLQPANRVVQTRRAAPMVMRAEGDGKAAKTIELIGSKLKKKPTPFPGDEWLVEQLNVAESSDSSNSFAEEVKQLTRRRVADNDANAADGEASPDGKPWPPRERNYTMRQGQVAVRFVNTSKGGDVVAVTDPGMNLLQIGDSHGVRIPRGCRSGLCGACTVDMEDPMWEGGRQTIRACQTGAVCPDGVDEMVIDLHRTSEQRQQESQKRNPYDRFNELDTTYKAAAAPVGAGANRIVTCTTCEGSGQHVCPVCAGRGELEGHLCTICMGMHHVRCAECQGVGERKLRAAPSSMAP